jgi:hypothetical protein
LLELFRSWTARRKHFNNFKFTFFCKKLHTQLQLLLLLFILTTTTTSVTTVISFGDKALSCKIVNEKIMKKAGKTNCKPGILRH